MTAKAQKHPTIVRNPAVLLDKPFQYVLAQFAIENGWDLSELVRLLKADADSFARFANGADFIIYSQDHVIEKGWKGALAENSKLPPDVIRKFESDFDDAVICLPFGSKKQYSPEHPWHACAAEFVGRRLKQAGLAADANELTAENAARAALDKGLPPLACMARVWKRVIEKDSGLSRTTYREVMRACCRLAGINVGEPKPNEARPFLDYVAMHLIRSMPQ